ncbi:MAG: hypothetical protein IME94_02110 [Proteobacteria bacterium]|nr:hypothetical protein [Pseudomonadota bacterium]
MIGRLLLILGIFFFMWLGYRFLKKIWLDRLNDVETQEQETQKIQQIKACRYCNIHIPENEGIDQDGDFFCNYEHLDSFLKHKAKHKTEHKP